MTPLRAFAGLVAAALLVGACADTPGEEALRLRVGIVGEPRTGNPWEAAALGDAPTRYVQPDPASLYTFIGPTYTLAPFLAADEPPAATGGGDEWTVTVTMSPAARWSDGMLVTAGDVAFTFDTVRRLGLAGAYASMWPEPGAGDGAGVVAVDEVDPATVRIVFDARPDPGVWPFGVGTAAIFPAHHWRPLLEGVEDADGLYELPGVGAPTATGFVLAGGDGWSLDADDGYWRSGTRVVVYGSGVVEQVRDGDATTAAGGEPGGDIVAEMDEGPFVGGIDFRTFADAGEAADALAGGTVDLVLAEDGLPRAEYRRLLADPAVDVAVNPRLGFRYVGFDTTAFPTSDGAFRRALACRLDSAALAVDVLGGAVEAVETLVPAGLAAWHDPDVAAECAGLTEQERFERAVAILGEGGWTWTVPPAWDETNRDVLPAGAGLAGPGGVPVPSLGLLAPAVDVDPARATFAAHLAEAARQLGIPVTVAPLGLGELAGRIAAGPGTGTLLWIGGWELPPFPDHVFRLFADGPADFTGYRSPDLAAAGEAFAAAPTVGAAAAAVRDAEGVLARDLPYVPLFTETIIEARRMDVSVPFVHVPDGLQRLDGALTYVRVGG